MSHRVQMIIDIGRPDGVGARLRGKLYPAMPRPQPLLPDNESKILIAIYESPELTDTYSLIRVLDPSGQDRAAAFREALAALEGLIVRGYVDGAQLKGADGMYFHKIKLKYAGKQAAIRERQRVAEFKKNFPKIVEEANRVAAEMSEFEEKNKRRTP